MNLKKGLFLFLSLSFFISFNFVHAGFVEYNDQIKQIGYDEAKKECANTCPTDQKYYQLTTGVPFIGANAKKCSCIPVSSGMQFFMTGILKFVLGSVATVATIIIMIAGFMWSFSAGNKNTVSKAREMITNAVIGLVMTLTCGLMLQVVNPALLGNKILSIDKITIKGIEKAPGVVSVGGYCNVGFDYQCSPDLICTSLSVCNSYLTKYYTLPQYGNDQGMCIPKDKKLACIDQSCDSSFVCMNNFMSGNLTTQTFCNSGKCSFPTGDVDTSKPKVGERAVCGDSANGAGCQDIYNCLKTFDGADLHRCYPKSCENIMDEKDKYNTCDKNKWCCAYGTSCNDGYCVINP